MNFNGTPQITRNDAEIFIPITCQENAGMTGPIHAIVWTMLNESWKAEGEFNRSLQACTYGEFHVRNEVCHSLCSVHLFILEEKSALGRYSSKYHWWTRIQVSLSRSKDVFKFISK